jgi:hypothetical protein
MNMITTGKVNEAKPRNIILHILLIMDNIQYDWGVMK